MVDEGVVAGVKSGSRKDKAFLFICLFELLVYSVFVLGLVYCIIRVFVIYRIRFLVRA